MATKTQENVSPYIVDLHDGVWGDFSGIRGSVLWLTGDVSGITGNASGVNLDCTGREGDVADLVKDSEHS